MSKHFTIAGHLIAQINVSTVAFIPHMNIENAGLNKYDSSSSFTINCTFSVCQVFLTKKGGSGFSVLLSKVSFPGKVTQGPLWSGHISL